jgi:uncharacterized SAM-binding protein YcdF (DUF218 family)
MGFVITKILLSLILPPASLVIIMAIGLFTIPFKRMFGSIMIASGFLLLYLFSITPVSDFLLKTLESYAPPIHEMRRQTDAIVVLAGGVRDLSWVNLEPQPSATSIERLVDGVRLYRELHVPLVIIGGNGNPFEQQIKEAESMGRVAKGIGVPDKDMIIENEPRNTLESAIVAGKLINGRHIILVTSAYHMKRASAMFRKQGFDVTPEPAGYRSEQKGISLYSLVPRAGSLYDSSAALAEFLSIFWYTITGAL